MSTMHFRGCRARFHMIQKYQSGHRRGYSITLKGDSLGNTVSAKGRKPPFCRFCSKCPLFKNKNHTHTQTKAHTHTHTHTLDRAQLENGVSKGLHLDCQAALGRNLHLDCQAALGRKDLPRPHAHLSSARSHRATPDQAMVHPKLRNGPPNQVLQI